MRSELEELQMPDDADKIPRIELMVGMFCPDACETPEECRRRKEVRAATVENFFGGAPPQLLRYVEKFAKLDYHVLGHYPVPLAFFCEDRFA